ncbi:GSCFA domain-containing protein [Burkholderia aenigmatica]|uniref:GSCFA domain-containing protein n=1 Tax=Burkholderia aenigmatica TaxID=2015348 RepID=UPI003B438D3E
MTNPYRDLPAHNFWRKGVTDFCRQEFDPVTSVRFKIEQTDKVATAGSCFAQHISRRLSAIGFNYFVSEQGFAFEPAERVRRNFGVFSARFGNIYTARQLVQLFDEAFHGKRLSDDAWTRPDGRFVDPYRPQIEPDGFGSALDVRAARFEHLCAVRNMLTDADVFVFTLGLTESWMNKADGAVYPLAPGVAGGTYDPERYQFVNFSVAEVEADLHYFITELRKINEKVRILFTVSPVPLIATFEPRNVLVSTTYSKSVLRVAAETMLRTYDFVDYFPSFEIITGSYNFGMYYEDDAREVNSLGVSHAMRMFLKNYAGQQDDQKVAPLGISATDFAVPQVVCDEEAIASINR